MYKIIEEKGLKRERNVCYQFKDEAPLKFSDEEKKEYEKVLIDDLKKWGKKNPKVLYQNCTRYFPRWKQEEINKGYPWIVKNEMQGKYKNTYYIGSSVCFEAVECVIEYNLELLNTIKC